MTLSSGWHGCVAQSGQQRRQPDAICDGVRCFQPGPIRARQPLTRSAQYISCASYKRHTQHKPLTILPCLSMGQRRWSASNFESCYICPCDGDGAEGIGRLTTGWSPDALVLTVTILAPHAWSAHIDSCASQVHTSKHHIASAHNKVTARGGNGRCA